MTVVLKVARVDEGGTVSLHRMPDNSYVVTSPRGVERFADAGRAYECYWKRLETFRTFVLGREE